MMQSGRNMPPCPSLPYSRPCYPHHPPSSVQPAPAMTSPQQLHGCMRSLEIFSDSSCIISGCDSDTQDQLQRPSPHMSYFSEIQSLKLGHVQAHAVDSELSSRRSTCGKDIKLQLCYEPSASNYAETSAATGLYSWLWPVFSFSKDIIEKNLRLV